MNNVILDVIIPKSSLLKYDLEFRFKVSKNNWNNVIKIKMKINILQILRGSERRGESN